ncbi:MAG: hypothetical protein ACI9EX_001942 [Oleispira sp.]
MKNSIKKFIKNLFIIILFSLPVVCSAESNNDNLLQFKISSLQLFSSFSAFIYFQGDDRNRTRLLNAKEKGDQAISLLPNSKLKLKLKWIDISNFVASYKTHRFDGLDMSMEVGWSIHQKELIAILAERNKVEATGIADVQIKMEIILSQYMGYANSTTGGYGVSYGNVSLEEQIEIMQKELSELAQADNKYQSLFEQWSYIHKALLAYNTNVAPFIVLHTFDRMRKIIAGY